MKGRHNLVAKFTNTIAPEHLKILAECSVVGNNILITSGQLSRPDYLAVNKVLELMGGKWNRKAKAHVYPEPPDDLLDTVLLTGEITDKKKLFQFFETPEELALRMVNLARVRPQDDVLEPSAGNGAIARCILGIYSTPSGPLEKYFKSLTLIDYDKERTRNLAERGFATRKDCKVIHTDFLTYSGKFDKIIMNPPFTRGQDVAHIKHAIGMLRPGGRLVAICSGGPRAEKELNPLSSQWIELPAGTFAQSGTNVRTVLMRAKA